MIERLHIARFKFAGCESSGLHSCSRTRFSTCSAAEAVGTMCKVLSIPSALLPSSVSAQFDMPALERFSLGSHGP
jgi:hypothetical protein